MDSGEEPRSKKLAIEPTTTTNLPLPEELVLCCLARVSRLHYPILSLVSKTFRSLTSSPELYQTRSLLNRTENCLYVCLRFPNDPELRWFTLCRKPDKTLKKKKKKKTSTSGNVLGQVRILGTPPPVEWSNLVAVGHRLYAVSPGPCSSNALFLDCRTHAWVETPSLRFPHTFPECAGMMYLPGGSENPDSVNCLQVFNVQTQTWNVPPGEKKIFRLRDLQGRAYQNNDVAAAAGSGSGSGTGTGRWLVVARVKEYTTHLESCDTLCLIDKTFYRYESSSGKLVWSNRYVESDLWRKVQGLEGLPKFPRYSNVYLVQSCGGKLVVFWDKHVRSREEKMIWCAEISLETRSSGDGVWGKVEWFDAVLTVPKSYKFVYAIAATL
ncbi:putative F-box/kelch-repeat protein [Raphanus sativus]|nr:putative F-box/kelch-repeat protein [Raphanus sativus]